MELTTVLFDIDRTLVDIRQSYEQAIRLVVAEYIVRHGGERLDPQQVCSEDDLYQLWWRPELADVWYLTYAFVRYYLTSQELRPATTAEYVQKLLVAPGTNWEEVIASALGEADRAQLDNGQWNKIEAQTLFQNFFCGQGWIVKEKVYDWLLQDQTGLYRNDQLIGGDNTRQVLAKAQSEFNLGIATARPRDEALQCIRQLGLAEFFPEERVATLELGSKAERIRHVLQQLPNAGNIAYCGDTVADLKAVAELQKQGIPIIGVGVNVVSEHPELMQRQQQLLTDAGAVMVCDDVLDFTTVKLNELKLNDRVGEISRGPITYESLKKSY